MKCAHKKAHKWACQAEQHRKAHNCCLRLAAAAKNMFSAEGGPPPALMSPSRGAIDDGAAAAAEIEARCVNDVELAGHGLRLVNDRL